MLKRNIFKILAIVFFLLAGATLYNSNKHTATSKIINVQTPNLGVSTNPTGNILGRENRAPTTELKNPTPTNIPTSIIKGSDDPTPTNVLPVQPTPTISTNSTNSTNSTKLTVSLSIAGSSVGSFDIPQGSNQCDVLTQALSQGKIQSLNMRYNNDYGTNAVYQINGVGKENVVWWTFKVNDQSPSQGCSYIKVNNGDNVLWEYVGS